MAETVDPTLPEIGLLAGQVNLVGDVLGSPDAIALRLPPPAELLGQWSRQLEHQRRHSSQRFTVMLLGEYSSGKSTLLNALLALPPTRRLPVRDDPTTALPVRLRYRRAGDPDARWVRRGVAVPEDVQWNDALRESTQGQRSRQDVEEVTLYVEHDLLRYADFVDMPGTGTAWYRAHTQVTRDYIANSEGIIWVIGAEEPSREGLRDIMEVRHRRVTLIPVFNAWGCLDPSRDSELRVDQNDIEESVRADFPDLFKDGPGFRVFAQKAMEAIDAGVSEPDGYGVAPLQAHLLGAYLGTFEDFSEERRCNVRRQVVVLASDIRNAVRQSLPRWEEELERLRGDAATVRAKRIRVNSLEHQVRAQMRALAADFADRIVAQIKGHCDVFVEDHITITNFELFKNCITERQRQQLQQEMQDTLKRDYLKLDQPGNWFDRQVADYAEEAWTVLEAEWRKVLDEIELDHGMNASVPDAMKPSIPFDALRRAAMDSVKNVLIRMGGLLFIGGVLLMIPGLQVVDTLAIAAMGIISLFHDPMARCRDNAKRRIGHALDSQRPAVKQELVRLIMEQGERRLKGRFEELLRGESTDIEEGQSAVVRGIDALRSLSDACGDVIGVEAVGEANHAQP